MTRDPYPPLRPQAPPRRRAQSTPWLMILGVAVLALLAGAVIAILLGEGDGDGVGGLPGASATASPSGSASASETASASASASTSPSGSAQAGPPPPLSISPDTLVVTTVEGLAIRPEPGRSSEPLGRLASGTQGYVVSGPSEADGFRWYLVSGMGLPPVSGCVGPIETDPYSCPIWFGWLAAASEDGEPWLEPAELDCPSEPYTADALITRRTDLERLACQGSAPFTFRAWWPELPDGEAGGACMAEDEPYGWLLCQDINVNQVTIDESEGYGGMGARVSIDPSSGLSMPERGTWVELRVHLDDPAAQGCGEGAAEVYAEPIPEHAILFCRGQMVLEAVTPVDGP